MNHNGWGRISEVNIGDPSTWVGRTFVTFDMDWAHDSVMRDTHEILLEAGVPSTWFVTHDAPFLEELRADPSVELGIHPNFNKLLKSDLSNGHSVEEVVQRLVEVVPEARSVRAHSLLQSSRILDVYLEAGLTHDATHLIESAFAGGYLRPWRHWNGLVRVPLGWEDDLAVLQAPGAPSLDPVPSEVHPGRVRQLNFHPIHVFLNTDSLSLYERTRPLHNRPEALAVERSQSVGIRTLLQRLVSEGHA